MANKKSLNIYEKWERTTLLVNSIRLDPKNVRLDMAESERAKIDQGSIINDLFSNEDAFQVLENIVENGWFVDELPIVIKEKGKYIVIEGNRRVAALKVLQNPHLAPAFISKVKPLSDSVVPIENIDVLVAPNRSDANTLLANKHTRVTRRPWKPLRQAHFYYSQLSNNVTVDNLKKNYKGVDIDDFIKMCEVHRIASSYDFGDIIINNKVRQQRTFPVSTLERLYGDQGFRQYLNFDFDKNGKIKISSSKKRFDEEFKKVILDAVDKNIDTRTLNSEESRRSYYTNNLRQLNKTKGKTTSGKYTPKDPIKKNKSSTTGIFERTLKCTLPTRGIERVYAELQTINYTKFPNATHDLLRSFLEAVLKEYLKLKGHTVQAKRQGGYVYLDDVLKGAEEYFRKTQNHQIRQIVNAVIKDKEFLDSINHNPSIFSTASKVKDAADQVSDLVKFIFKDYK